MIKFVLPIAVLIAEIFGISYFWINSSTQGRKKIALGIGIVAAMLLGLIITIYLIID